MNTFIELREKKDYVIMRKRWINEIQKKELMRNRRKDRMKNKNMKFTNFYKIPNINSKEEKP